MKKCLLLALGLAVFTRGAELWAQDANPLPTEAPVSESERPVALGAGSPELDTSARPAQPQAVQPADTRAQTPGRSDGFDSEGDEIIADPTLPPAEAERPATTCGTCDDSARLTLLLHSRSGFDLAWDDDREDVYEATQIGLIESTHRISDDLRVSLGLRARHVAARRRSSLAAGGPWRASFDVAPTSGYADITVAPGAHARLGFQRPELGRFDLFSSLTFLDTLDLRSGPGTIPEAAAIAQVAARADVDVGSNLSLRAIYVPVFTPHRVSMVGSDYAMLTTAERSVNEAVRTDPAARRTRERLEETVRRSGLVRLGEEGFPGLGPKPTLTEPQGAVRANLHGAPGELALTLGTGLEHIPALRFSDGAKQFLADTSPVPDTNLLLNETPVTVEYNRFHVVTLDAAGEIGPVQIGSEFSFMFHRTFVLIAPGEIPEPARTDVALVAVRAEYLHSEQLQGAVELFVSRALDDPPVRGGHYLGTDERRALQGAALALRWEPLEDVLSAELLAVAFTGPSTLLAPRVLFAFTDGWAAELGGFVVGGDRVTDFSSANIALGGMYTDTDQVYLGLRFEPELAR